MKHVPLVLPAGHRHLAFGSHLGSLPRLNDPNEGEYAEVAREMVESGEWISPQLNYVINQHLLFFFDEKWSRGSSPARRLRQHQSHFSNPRRA